jgi:hypothetical protein
LTRGPWAAVFELREVTVRPLVQERLMTDLTTTMKLDRLSFPSTDVEATA